MTALLSIIRTRARIIAVLAVLALSSAISMAQTITVPVDTIFDEAQVWIGVFAPILAIGIGIGIALAILNFVGRKILEAFR